MGSEESKFTQFVYGNYNAVAGPNSTAIVNVFPSPPQSKPLQKPPRVQNFTGRVKEIDFLLSNINTNNIITISGVAGIGKTALISEMIWLLTPDNNLPESFPDGIIYYNFYSQQNAEIAFENFSRLFGEPPLPTPYLAAQRALANKRLLAVLDSFEECDAPSQVIDVFSGCKTIVISRTRKSIGNKHLEISPLEVDDSIKLLVSFVGNRNKTDLRTITHILGESPYAICLAGHYLAESQEDISLFTSRLSREPIRVLSETDSISDNISILLNNSINCLSDDTQRLLMLLGVLDFETPNISAGSYVLNYSEFQTAKATNELAKYGIISKQGKKTNFNNRLLHSFIKTKFKPSEKEICRLGEYYSQMLSDYKTPDLFDTEYKNLILTVNNSVNMKLWSQVQILTWGLLDFLDTRGYWTERISMASAGYLASTELLDRKREIDYLVVIGLTHINYKNYLEALHFFQHAFQKAINIESVESQSIILGNMAIANIRMGSFEIAIRNNLNAFRAAKQIDNQLLQSNHIGNIGNLAFDLGKYDQAVRFYIRALSALSFADNSRTKINLLSNIANSYSKKNAYEKAVTFSLQALSLSRLLKDNRIICTELNNLGSFYREINKTQDALICYKEALKIAKSIKDQLKECSILNNLANVLISMGQSEKAQKYLGDALKIALDKGDENLEATISWNLGFLLIESDITKAISLMTKSVEYEKQHNGISAKIYEKQLQEIKAKYL